MRCGFFVAHVVEGGGKRRPLPLFMFFGLGLLYSESPMVVDFSGARSGGRAQPGRTAVVALTTGGLLYIPIVLIIDL